MAPNVMPARRAKSRFAKCWWVDMVRPFLADPARRAVLKMQISTTAMNAA